MYFYCFLQVTHKESLTPQNFWRRCKGHDIGNAHKSFFETTMTLSGYDQRLDNKIHFVAVALCAICADDYARGRSKSYSNFMCRRWMENLFFGARAWETNAFKTLLDQLFCRVSSSLALNLVAPKLISSLWAEVVANLGRVQKKQGKLIHNVVASVIDVPCAVEMSWQLGPLQLIHVALDGWTDFSWTYGCDGLETQCRKPCKPSSLHPTPDDSDDCSHFVSPDGGGWFREQ